MKRVAGDGKKSEILGGPAEGGPGGGWSWGKAVPGEGGPGWGAVLGGAVLGEGEDGPGGWRAVLGDGGPGEGLSPPLPLNNYNKKLQ